MAIYQVIAGIETEVAENTWLGVSYRYYKCGHAKLNSANGTANWDSKAQGSTVAVNVKFAF